MSWFQAVLNKFSKSCVYCQSLKRLVTILFTITYLVTTSGVLTGQHLCMGRVKHRAVFEKPASDCGMGMEMEKDTEGCCDDEWILQKVEDDQQVSAEKTLPKATYHLLYEVPLYDWQLTLSQQTDESEIRNTGPPDIPHPDLNILYHSLKIPLL